MFPRGIGTILPSFLFGHLLAFEDKTIRAFFERARRARRTTSRPRQASKGGRSGHGYRAADRRVYLSNPREARLSSSACGISPKRKSIALRSPWSPQRATGGMFFQWPSRKSGLSMCNDAMVFLGAFLTRNRYGTLLFPAILLINSKTSCRGAYIRITRFRLAPIELSFSRGLAPLMKMMKCTWRSNLSQAGLMSSSYRSREM